MARLHVELNAAFRGADLPADVYQRLEGGAKIYPPMPKILAPYGFVA